MGGSGKGKRNTVKPSIDEAMVARYCSTVGAMDEESERATPLLAGELLSDALERALRLKFDATGLSNDDRKRLLTNFAAPIYTLSARILFCRAFGLIDDVLVDLLGKMREIRNHCAHAPKAATLDDPEIEDQVREICEFVMANIEYAAAERTRNGEPTKAIRPKDKKKFVVIAAKFLVMDIDRSAREDEAIKNWIQKRQHEGTPQASPQ